MLCGGVQELANKRLEQSKRLTQLRYELRFEEARLHALLSPHARVVLKGKSIVLFFGFWIPWIFLPLEFAQLNQAARTFQLICSLCCLVSVSLHV